MAKVSAIFSGRIETGGHRASIVAVAEGRADICAIDCRSWQLAQQHEPRAADLQVVGWTARRKGLPLITSTHTPPEIVGEAAGNAWRRSDLQMPITSPRLGATWTPSPAFSRKGERAMTEQYLLPTLAVFVPLVVATLVAYVLLINPDLHSRHRH